MEWFYCSVAEAVSTIERVVQRRQRALARRRERRCFAKAAVLECPANAHCEARQGAELAECGRCAGGRQEGAWRHHKRALTTASARGGRMRKSVYLSRSTGRVFERLRSRVCLLQNRHAYDEARCLAYAAEAEIAARRAVRETHFPRTSGLDARDPSKARRLACIKAQYERAYQHLCYVRRAGNPERCAMLTVARLLRDAWGVLLAQPPPLRGEGPVIALGL